LYYTACPLKRKAFFGFFHRLFLAGLLFTLQPVIAQNWKECYDNQQNKRQELKFYG